MKRFVAGFLLASLAAAIVGCGNNGSAGGPGVTDPPAKPPLFGQTDDTFNLTTSSVSLKQGESAQETIGIKRGTNFDQDVTLTFEDLPKGVTLDPNGSIMKIGSVLRSGATEAKFTLTAGDEAALGDFTVKVIGHPAKGADATNEFKLTVAKKDTFTLSMPFWTTGLKQGESKSVLIAISRDKRFDQDVTLKFDSLPKGVTVEPSSGVIKNGESDVKVVLKAADDAGLGDFSVKVTGHPTKGADASHEFKFTVAKK